MARDTVNAYSKVIKNYKEYGFTEEQIRVLGFAKTRDILRMTPQGVISELSKKNIEELKKLKLTDIYHKIKNPSSQLDKLKQDWKRASGKEKEEFLRFINAKGENTTMD